MTILGKILDFLFGKIIEEIVLIHEAFSLSDKEKKIIKDYAGKSTYELTKHKEIDELIRKSMAAMTTTNRACLTNKGEKKRY